VNTTASRLWLAIRFSDLPLTALKLDYPHSMPMVVIEKKRVIFANMFAEHSGARVGMDITTAQLLAECEVTKRDQVKEQCCLDELSEQLYQFSPYIERYSSTALAESGLLLEISSCLKLFGGLKKLTGSVTRFLEGTTYAYNFGLGHSQKAAWYLSFCDYDIEGDETKATFITRLNKLPIALFFDYPKAADVLSKTGFSTFGDLVTQIEGNSISSFRKRLGKEFTNELCEIYDIDQNFMQSSLFEKPRDIFKPKEWFEQEIEFDYPVTIVDQLKPAIENLLHQLTDYLRKRQQQCQYIEWIISDIYRNKESVKINSDAPQSHWQLLYDLSLIHFDNNDLPFEVDTVKLLCTHMMPLQHSNQVLNFDASKRKKKSVQDFVVTIAKLKSRLGDAAIYKVGYCDSRVPELTNIMVALADKCNEALPDIHLRALRPTWLLTKPEIIEERSDRLYWDGYLSTIVGPERIIGNWWDEPVARDYYLAKRHDNIPVWIFFNLYDKQWYVHGVFA